MLVQWSKLFLRTGVWLCAEIILNSLGLDNLADYSEFVFQARDEISVSRISMSLATSV